MRSRKCLIFAGLLGTVLCTGLTMSMSILGLTQCGRPRCTCFNQRRLVVCTPGLGPPYTEIPAFSRQEAQNMTRINLSGNALTYIGARDFNKITWPHLEVVDLRLNPKLDCKSLDNIPDGIIVYTDCIDDDYEVDPALIGDGTSQKQEDEDGYQMFREQYSQMGPHSEISDSSNKEVNGKKQQSDSSRFPGSSSLGYKQSTSNSRVGNDGYDDSSSVDSYSPAHSNLEAIRGDRRDKVREELEEPASEASEKERSENDDDDNSKLGNRKNRKPKKLVIEFRGVMKVLIP